MGWLCALTSFLISCLFAEMDEAKSRLDEMKAARENEAIAASAAALAAVSAKKPAKGGAKAAEAPPLAAPVQPPSPEEDEGAARIKELKKAYREVRLLLPSAAHSAPHLPMFICPCWLSCGIVAP